MTSRHHDSELGMDRPITRRDFLNGIAVGVGGVLGASILPGWSWGDDGAVAPPDPFTDYPPARTGMRGSHPGAFEVAHSMRDGEFLANSGAPVITGETYDLVVVGAGISGLAAAFFYRQRVR